MLVESHAPPSDDRSSSRALILAGRITHAVRELEKSLAAEVESDRVAPLLADLLECHLARGELAAAGRLGDRLGLLVAQAGPDGAIASHALGELFTARGEHEAALLRYIAAGALLGNDDDLPAVPWRSGAALALTRLGRHREAAVLSAEHLERARTTGSAYVVAHALRTAAATNADGNRLLLLREARAVLAGLGADRLAAQIDTDLAALLTLEGGRAAADEAVVLLRSAEKYADLEDLFPLQQRIRRTLERLGEQPRRIRSETLASLTSTEQRAARLAADGLTNREIAAQLSVTVKAVEWHLSHVYRKLGIRSRANLADTFGVPV